MSHTPQEYRQRYCAFIDVLGFSEMIASITRENTIRETNYKFRQVRDVLLAVHSPTKTKDTNPKEADFRAQSISDAVAISTSQNDDGLLVLFDAIQNLALNLLQQGYFIRGAVVKGLLYHQDNAIFGDALIKAYRFESTVARYPRIMVVKDVADDLHMYADRRQGAGMEGDMVDHYYGDQIIHAHDGPMFLNILRPLIKAILEKNSFYDLDQWLPIRSHLETRLRESVDNPHHFEKVKWFVQYWNDRIPPGRIGFEQIRYPGITLKHRYW